MGWLAVLGLDGRGSAADAEALADNARGVVLALPVALAAQALGALALLLAAPRLDAGLGGLLALLLAAGAVLALAPRLAAGLWHRPRLLAQATTGYALLAGAGWAAAALLVPSLPGGTAVSALAAVTVAALAPVPAAGFVFLLPLLAIVAVRLPIAGAALLGAMSLLLGAVHVAAARHALAAARRRIAGHRAARQASVLLAEVEENGRSWFWQTDAAGDLTYFSRAHAEAIDRPLDTLLGRAFTDLVLSDGDSGERTLGFHLSTRLAFSDVAVRANVAGEPRWWTLSGRPATDEYGNFLGFRGSGSDLTERRRSEAEISRLAKSDPLTGLPNRLVMRSTLEASLREAQDPRGGRAKPCALLMLDLDRFKTVNDTLGHPIGDALLRHVAERLTSVVGERGQCGRLGGDEFQVVLPGIGDAAVLGALADRIIERIAMPYTIEGSHISIGTSIGIAIAPDHGATADSLIRNADLALYAAKGAGKGLHRFYEAEMHANAKDRRLLENDLRNVLGEGGLHLVYQPVVDATSERISGFEALVRWNHPTRGAVSPAAFIPIAEEIGLIPAIGEWVLRTACMEAARWPDHARVAVNISPIQFANPALPGIVLSALAAAPLRPERLELEITEGVFLNDGEATDAMFARLKGIGVRFALDDFGTGYSSLGYLKKAPFDKIKIDQSFVRGAAIPGNRNAAIIKAIVSLAESLDMDTTAEGAETHDELELIRGLGCSHVQGYIFGRPMPAAEARERVASGELAQASGFLASRSPRVAVLRSATLRCAGRVLAGRVRNLSTTGAMIEAAAALAPGTPVEVEFPDGGRHAGTVRWAQQGRFGMVFDAPFDLEVLNAAARPMFARAGRR